jgi:tetratricopeptide (TPR) repeat protein
VLLAQNRNLLGGLFAAQDNMPEAQMEFDEAARVLEPLVATEQASAEARFELSRSYYLAARRSTLRLPPEPMAPEPLPGARPPLPPGRPRGPRMEDREDRRGIPEGTRPAPGAGPPGGPLRRRLRQGQGPEGEAGRRREHLSQLDRAIELLAALSAESPLEPKYLHLSALCLREREAILAGPAGEPNVGEVVRLLGDLAERFPSIARYRLDLAETLVMQARGPGGVESLNRALVILQALADERPTVPAYRFALGHAHLRLSQAHESSGNLDAALHEARRALSLHKGLAEEHADASSFVITTALCESVVGRLLQRGGELEEAKQLLLSATARLEKLNVAGDPRPHIRSFAARCFDQLSRVYHELGEHANARAALETARTLGPGPRFGP